MADDLDKLDYYSLLEVEPTANVAEVRAAFRRFALKYHPDRHAGSEPAKIERATRIYRRGSEALETLVDPTRRKAYDIVLARGEMRLTQDAQMVARSRSSRSSRPGARRSSPGASRRAGPEGAGRATAPRDIQSPTAKAYSKRALEASKARDYRTALRMVEAALQQEPAHPILVEARKRLLPYLDE